MEPYYAATNEAIRKAWLSVARFHNTAALKKLSMGVTEGKLTEEAFEWLKGNVDAEFPGPDITLLETVKELYGSEGVEEVMRKAEELQKEEHRLDRRLLRKKYGFFSMLKQGFKSLHF